MASLHSQTGCRANQEVGITLCVSLGNKIIIIIQVLDLADPDAAWTLMDIEEMDICHGGSGQMVSIDCY